MLNVNRNYYDKFEEKKYYDKFKMKKQKLSFIAGLTDEIYISFNEYIFH